MGLILASQGSTGDPVKQLQTMLNFVGANPPLTVDGIFGSKTKAATVAFQKQAQLTQDGIVGPKTAKALMAASFRKVAGK
jgi:peptidoglycan hydrolase-like protein with peptidoglycan-binding domain